ncbi:MAG: C25 family cysteine peptidase, partial [Thermoleophilia bacterium]|nr:C25 family cysteine peptidase [Thermoleophilia bacterium]
SIVAGPSIKPAASFILDSIPPETGARPGKTDTLWVGLYGDQAMDVFLDFVEVRYAEKLSVTKAEPQLEFAVRDSGTAEFGIEGATGDVLLLDVTDPGNPRQITETGVAGGRRTCRVDAAEFKRLRCALTSGLMTPKEIVRRSPGGLRNPANSADYIIVCPDEFYSAAALFARYRDGNVAGLPNARVRVMKLSEVYDDYAFGVEEPGAIKRLLQAKRPAYVMLAGDGTYDYRNILNLRTGPVLPPYELGYDIDPEVYGYAARGLDAWYADLDGEGGTPDLILGRVTVRSAIEMRMFLDKVKRYETQPLGYWAKRYLLLADDDIEGSPDRGDQLWPGHVRGCEDQARAAAGLLDPVKVYLNEYPLTGTNLKAEASAELIRQLNSGALLWCFFGHGAGFQLCHEQVLHITNTVPSIHNGSRIPLAFFGSCGVGRFEDTRYEAIAEELVRKEDGCIATVGATKATSPGGNELLAWIMFDTLMYKPEDPIGPAFFKAYTHSNITYHLFGDPATVLRMPRPGAKPEVRPDTFYPGGRNEFEVADTANRQGLYEVSAREAVWHRE